MRIISYIIFSISLFLIGLAAYFVINDERIRKKKKAEQLAEAREAKRLKALKNGAQTNEDWPDALEELENKIIEENADKKKKAISN